MPNVFAWFYRKRCQQAAGLYGLDAEHLAQAPVINFTFPTKQHFHVPQAQLRRVEWRVRILSCNMRYLKTIFQKYMDHV